MIRLVSTSDKLQIVLGGAVATNELQVVTCYSDKTSSTYTGGSTRVDTNGTTDVDVVGAPGASTVRDVDLINVYQRDTASATVTLKIDVSGTEHILGKWTLAAGDVLTYTHGHAWQVIDSTGQLKGSGTGGGGGAVDSVNGQTGTVVLDADDIDDTSTTNKFVTASDVTNLGNLSGTNSGDVTLAGTPDYITISGQTITRGQVDLTTDVTGDLPLANLAQASGASKLLGRGAGAGGGDYEEISLGSGLSLSGTTLSSTGGGASALDDLSDVTITTPSASDVLTYNGSAWVNGTIAVPPASLADGDYGDITVSGSGTTLTIDAGVVTFAKMQAVSANVLLGNDGTGTTVEEISCTAAGRALLDDADAAAQRTTLGLGTAAVESASAFATAAQGSLADSATQPGDLVTTLNVSVTDRLLGRDTTGAGAAEELTVGGGIEFTGSGGIQRSALTGDVTASAGSNSTTLATVNSNVGTYGSATQASQVTVNAKGLVTAAANVTVTPAVGSITGLGTGVGTFLATPSSANLAAAVTDETGSGALVFATSPTLVTPAIGTPSSGTLTNCTGLPTAGIVDDAVTYAKMQNVSATSRVLGRKTAGAGDPEECTLSELLDFVGSAAQGDILYRGASGWSRLGVGTSGYYLKTQGAGADPTWAAVSGGSGGSVGTFPGGRLTTESGVAVSTSDRTSQSTLYYTPYVSDYIRLYNGSSVAEYSFTERSLALSGLTSGKNYDVFLYDNSGTLTLELTAWSTDTARATALAWQTGLGWVKSGTATRLYLGTIRTTSTTTTEDSGGGTSSSVGGKRFVWNAYNQEPRPIGVIDTTDSWTYNSTTIRQARATSGNKVEVVCGLSGSSIHLRLTVVCNTGTSSDGAVGIGEDSTTAFPTGHLTGWIGNFQNQAQSVSAILAKSVALGYHYYAWLECQNVTNNSTTFYGDAGVASGKLQSGITGLYKC